MQIKKETREIRIFSQIAWVHDSTVFRREPQNAATFLSIVLKCGHGTKSRTSQFHTKFCFSSHMQILII